MFSRLLRLYALLLLLSTTGCTTNNSTSELIGRAESIAINRPDSALNILRSIDQSTIRDKRDMAHYRLVLCETLYYNYIEGDNDSLTHPLVDYYIGSSNHDQRSRAMFQHATVKINSGEFDEAMYYFLEAEKSLEKFNNPRLMGLVHRAKGKIYGAEYLFNNALTEHLIAKECFEKIGSEYNIAYSNYDIGMIYLCLQQFSDAKEYLHKALEYAKTNEMNTLISEIITCLLDAYCSQGQYEQLAAIFEQYEPYHHYDPITYYRYRAIHHAHYGNEKMATDDLEQAQKHGCEQIHLEYTSYIVYDLLGNDTLALQYLEKCIKRQNNQIILSLEAPILNMQVELGINEKMELQMRSKYDKLIFSLIVAIVVVVLSCFTYIKLIRKKTEVQLLKNKVEDTLNALDMEANRVKALTAIANDKERMVSTMRKSIAEQLGRELGRISDLLDAYYSDITKHVKHNQVIAELDKYVKEFADSPKGYRAVEHFVNEYLDNIMTKLRSEMPSLREEDYRLLCLIYADFSSNAICMFMGYDKNKLYKHKSKLKATLINSKAEDKVLFIKNLR